MLDRLIQARLYEASLIFSLFANLSLLVTAVGAGFEP